MKIYVVAHKKADIEKLDLDSCYQLIRVGGYAKEESDLLSDRTGDNISDKNPNYCELTAQYWIWKNDKSSDVVGLCHYRRYLSTALWSADPRYILKEEQILQDLKKYDIILPIKPIARRKVKDIYLDFGRQRDLDTLREVIGELFPEYLEVYDSEMNAHCNYVANVLITTKKIYDDYSKWLFTILFEVEKRTDLTGYSVQEQRIYGFMSERLLGVWIKKNAYKLKKYRLINTETHYDLRAHLVDLVSAVNSSFR